MSHLSLNSGSERGWEGRGTDRRSKTRESTLTEFKTGLILSPENISYNNWRRQLGRHYRHRIWFLASTLTGFFICFQHNSVCGQSLAFFLPLSWGEQLEALEWEEAAIKGGIFAHPPPFQFFSPVSPDWPAGVTDYTLLFLSHRSRASTAQKTSNFEIRKQVCRAPEDRVGRMSEDRLVVR